MNDSPYYFLSMVMNKGVLELVSMVRDKEVLSMVRNKEVLGQGGSRTGIYGQEQGGSRTGST